MVMMCFKWPAAFFFLGCALLLLASSFTIFFIFFFFVFFSIVMDGEFPFSSPLMTAEQSARRAKAMTGMKAS